jgi:hypothetical protein
MATAKEYASWIVQNKDKKGTPEFEKVVAAYTLARKEEDTAAFATDLAKQSPLERAGVGMGAGGGLGEARAMTAGLTPEQKEEALRFGAATALSAFPGSLAARGLTFVASKAPALAPYIAPLATSLQTGGFTTGRTGVTGAQKVVDLATRGVGGAVPGATGAAIMNPEDAGSGALMGAGISMFAPPVIGWAYDRATRRGGDVRAGGLLRTAAGDQVNALRQLMQAFPDELPSRLLASTDLPALRPLQAILKRAEAEDPAQVVNAFRQREGQDLTDELNRLAGGATATETRAARDRAQAALRDVAAPQREEALGAARRTGEVMPRLEQIAGEAGAKATAATDEVRRFSDLVNRADDWARSWVAQRGVGEAGVRLPGRVEATATFPGQLAASGRQTSVGGPFERQVVDEGGAVARRIAGAAETSVREGARARTAQATLQSMKDRGLEPLDADALIARLQVKLRDPQVGTNADAKAGIETVLEMLNDWKNTQGVIDPAALEAIRKNGVSAGIAKLRPGVDSKSQKNFAAAALSEVTPLIDEAIVAAGGKGWPDYLKTFRGGMSNIKGMELANQIRGLYKSGSAADKQKIVDIIRGESPETIEELFGSGRYDIAIEMAKDLPFLRKLSDTLNADLRAAEQAGAGRAALANVESKRRFTLRFPFFTRVSTGVNEALAALESQMSRKGRDALIKAAQSGKDFDAVLSALPARDRLVFLAAAPSPGDWKSYAPMILRMGAKSGIGAAGAATAEPPAPKTNMMAPDANNAMRQF